jgi:hypothetical protein
MSAMRKAWVVTKAKPSNAPFFLAVCQAILAGITAHPGLFPSLPVLLSLFQAQVTSMAAAQQQARARVPGAAAARDTARDELVVTVEAIRAYVQGLCQLAPEQSATLVQAAAMKLAAVPVRSKPILGAKQGVQAGIVNLEANATLLSGGRKKGYRLFSWEYSLDGKVWVAVPATPYARTTVTGLTPLTTYEFRVSLTDKSGTGAWSQVLPTHFPTVELRAVA